MKKLLFDIQSGISGDMTVAAALDLGISWEQFQNELNKLELDFTIIKGETIKNGIHATTFNVEYPHQHVHRHLSHIKDIIENSDLKNSVKVNSLKVFKRLAEAEAKVHGTTVDKVHFHEVGAVDSIVDIVGAIIAFDMLEVDEFYLTPFTFGTGSVKCAHGTMAVPVPATAELTLGFPAIRTGFNGELVTPTGAAISTTLAKPVSELSEYKTIKCGYGAGTRNIEGLPNVLRMMIIESNDIDENVVEIQTNLDDTTGEIISYTTEKLMRNGALDVFTTPIGMKKGRPAIMVTLLSSKSNKEKLSRILLEETGALGLRYTEKKRICLDREFETLDTKWGSIKIKTSSVYGKKMVTPEYEDCKKIAKENNIPLRIIYNYILKNCSV